MVRRRVLFARTYDRANASRHAALARGQQQDHGSLALARAFELCRRSRRKHRRVRHPLNSGDAYTSAQVAGEQRVSSEPSSYFLTILSAIPTAIGTLKVSCL